MKKIRQVVLVLVSVAFAVGLSACGGGGSSSGVSKAATPFAGNYAGFEDLSITGPGGTFYLGPLPLFITIGDDGSVIVTDSDGIPYMGSLAGGIGPEGPLRTDQFLATAFISIPSPAGGVCLPSTYGYFGDILGTTITGNASGTFLCTLQGVSAFVTLGGPFTAELTAGGVAPGVTAPSIQPPSFGGKDRMGRKQRAIADGVGSVF